MNGQDTQNSKIEKTKNNSFGNNGSRTIGSGGNGGQNGQVASDARKIKNRTYINSKGYSIRRRAFRKERNEDETSARKESRKIEILAKADALAESARYI